MNINSMFELSLTLDEHKFRKALNRVYGKAEPTNGDEYIDRSMSSKGITVVYRDSQYKKKIKLIANPIRTLDDSMSNPDKFILKLKKRVDDYFAHKYELNDFSLIETILTTEIDVHDRERISDYIRVLQRVGKVKGFSPPSNTWINDDISFCLKGNSNGISFMLYDLEKLLRNQLGKSDSEQKQLKSIALKAEGLIRVEVRLTEAKAIRAYTDETSASGQIADLSMKSEQIFLDTFMRVVPFGNFHKKDKAVEIIRKEVVDQRIGRRMLRLLELVPEKKSLLLAQKALNCREIGKVMDMFAALDLSPITISKRHEMKYLQNLYAFL